MKTITVIVPCYNEELTINPYFAAMQAIEAVCPAYSFHYLPADDGSTDQTLSVLEKLSSKHSNVQYLSFSRNFGKEAALVAGLTYSQGEWVITMDVDLQHPPHLIPLMIKEMETEQYDMIATQRQNRQGEAAIRAFLSHKFYELLRLMTDIPLCQNETDFRLMDKPIVNSLLALQEVHRFSKGLFNWVGYRKIYLSFPNEKRSAGDSKWNLTSLFTYSIEGILSFSQVPLDIIAFIGFLVFILSISYAIFLAIRTLLFGNPTSGWTSTIVVILAMGGLQMLSLGIVGKYVGKTFMESKKRPLYFIQKTNLDLSSQKEPRKL